MAPRPRPDEEVHPTDWSTVPEPTPLSPRSRPATPPGSPVPSRARRQVTGPALALLAALLLGLAACGVDDPAQEVRAEGTPRAAPDVDLVPTTVAAVNAFGLDLVRTQGRLRSGNLVLSPWTVASVLAMARTGATGETRTQLDRALHITDDATFDRGMNAVDQLTAQRSGGHRSSQRKGTIDLVTARSLWAPRGTTFDPAFLRTLAADYGSGARVVDFRSDPEAARGTINTWVSGATNQAITQVVPRGAISDFTRMVGASALYPRAPWEVQFPADRTRPARFSARDDQAVEPPTMQLTTANGLLYGRGDGYEATELPYLGQELALLVVVPDPGTLDRFTADLDRARFEAIVQGLQPGPLDLRLPRFGFTTDVDLNEALRDLGLTDLLDERRAELSGITTDEPLSLSAVLHQSFISVDEEGSQAKAATVQAPTDPAAPGPATSTKLTVDRPFLFALRDRTTGLILAIGRVTNPLG